MKEEWVHTVISKISVAIFVAAGSGRSIHNNRPYHGIVINDAHSVKDYAFADGRVLHTHENEVFYLPKGSSYSVRERVRGGCYAINFDADIEDVPFVCKVPEVEVLLKSFRLAAAEWKVRSAVSTAAAMFAVYQAIYMVFKEKQREYRTQVQLDKLEPAIERLSHGFAGCSVAALAELCGMSEVYFRKLFHSRFGVSPKEYMIQKRIEYAKQLLVSGEFSVAMVASMCGYAEPCHFSREFTKRVGCAPKDYC